MPSPTERRRNNVRAGLFVSVALIMGLIVLVVLTDAIDAVMRATDTYTVEFNVASGVSNLKPGSDVRVGGVRMGRVNSIEPVVAQGEAFRTIAVEFSVDHRIKIFSDAVVLVSAPLIGAEAWLDIPNVGDPTSGKPPGNRLVGTASIGLLTSLLGSENAGKTDAIVENARVFSEFLSEVPDEYSNRVVPTLDNVSATSADVRSMMAELREQHWTQWAESVDTVMTWATSATADLDAAIAEGHGLLSDSRAVVSDNRERIDSTVANIQQVSERFKTETIDKFHALLTKGEEGLQPAIDVLESMRLDYPSWATDIGEALGNANLAAQQLKLTTIETRRSPWKLLYRPSVDELEHELLYEAARSFAVAAADLKAASESVRRVLDEHSERISGNEEAYQRLQRNLLDSLTKYEKAQQQLLDIMIIDLP